MVALAHQGQSTHGFDLPKAAGYHKKVPTWAEVLALVRQPLGTLLTVQLSESDILKNQNPGLLYSVMSLDG